MAISVTESELLDALAQAAQASAKGPEDARTTDELADATQKDVRHVRKALHQIAKEGRLVVHKVKRPALDGRLATVTAYTILPSAAR